MSVPMQCEWFYDVLSPFAYLQIEQFDRLPSDLDIAARPVVLGALLSHWQTRGPAEIPEKRRQTYRIAQWRAEQRGLPFRMPPAHPFNPIRALRLAIARGQTVDAARAVLRCIWRDGLDVSDDAGWSLLCQHLGTSPDDPALASTAVKGALAENTERAIGLGVFGVPTFVVGNQQFWGDDATDLLLAYLREPDMFSAGEWARISNLPVGVQRRGQVADASREAVKA